MQFTKNIHKNKYLYLFLIITPFLIISCLHLGNWITEKIGINFNPQGIGNTEWFLFWAAYIAGVCTLIAFLRTAEQNQRALEYQTEIHSIEREQEMLSTVMKGLYLREVYDIFTKHSAIEKVNLGRSTTEISKLLFLIVDARKNLIINDISLHLDVGIYNIDCDNCIHTNKCPRGKFSKEFVVNYKQIYDVLFENLSKYYEYVEVEKIFYELAEEEKYYFNEIKEAQKEISNLKKELENEDVQEIISILLKHISFLEEVIKKDYQRLEEIKVYKKQTPDKQGELHQHIKTCIGKITNYEENEISKLIGTTKNYIAIRKELAKNRLKGMPMLEYTPIEESRKCNRGC